jgi:hypothetical protein
LRGGEERFAIELVAVGYSAKGSAIAISARIVRTYERL